MKKITFTIALLVCSLLTYAKKKETDKSLENYETKKLVAQSICNCSATFNLGGYQFNFIAAYESSVGCDPFFATDSYGLISADGYSLAEGELSSFGLGLACGVNMANCPR
jgi:hypothetical protein